MKKAVAGEAAVTADAGRIGLVAAMKAKPEGCAILPGTVHGAPRTHILRQINAT